MQTPETDLSINSKRRTTRLRSTVIGAGALALTLIAIATHSRPSPHPAAAQTATLVAPAPPVAATPPVQATVAALLQQSNAVPVAPKVVQPTQAADATPPQADDPAPAETREPPTAWALAPVLTGLTISPENASPGDTVTVTYTISSPAPSDGIAIDVVGHPSVGDDIKNTVNFHPGETSVSLSTIVPSTFTGTNTITIDATYAGVTKEATATWTGPDPAPAATSDDSQSAPQSEQLPDCANVSDGSDYDTPCIDNGGNTTTYGDFQNEKLQHQQMQEDRANEQEQREQNEHSTF